MFGTIATMRPKAGQETAAAEAIDDWWRERSSKAEGAVCLHLYRGAAAGELVMAVVFDTQEHYEANANDPEQDAWYRSLVALLEADPEWADGDVIVSHSAGLDTVGLSPS
jgi:quinol monooxygenase YgiN